jgi:iron complex outermembrane recepter protein
MFIASGKARAAASALTVTLAIVGMPDANAQGTTASSGLETVIVTARRAEENIQSVPVSVTAFSAESLRENQIVTPEDLQISTPGVFLSGSGGRQNVVYQIRGQSKALSGPSSPAVVSYFAEVPDPTFGSFVPQYDMASVQVLKGPQGTLFGRNTTGGAVLYQPAPPTHEFAGFVSGSYGNEDEVHVQGALNIPLLADRIALRVAGDIHERDAYTRNLGVGGDIDDVDTEGARVSLLIEPIEGIRNLTIFDHYKSQNGGFGTVLTDVPSGPTLLAQLGLQVPAQQFLALQRSRGPYVVDTSIDQKEDNKRDTVVNRTEIALGSMQLVNIFGYRETDLNYVTNADGMPTLIADGTGAFPAGIPVDFIEADLNQETKQYSDELQLRGKLLDERLDWLLGVFWLKSEPNGPQGNTVSFAHIPGTPAFPAAYNFITEKSKAAFGHVTYGLDNIAEGLQIEAGIRYTEDEVESCTGNGVTASSGDAELDDCEDGTASILNSSSNSAKSNETTWTIGLNWQINQDLFTYVVSRHGYRAGGINSPSFSGRLTEFQAFEPETVTDYEIGVRSDWNLGDAHIRANVSAFLGDYSKVQAALTGVQSVVQLCNPASTNNPPGVSPDGDCDPANDPAGGTLLVNVGKSRVSGVDVELAIAPFADLVFNLAANFLDTKTRSFDPPTNLEPYIATDAVPFNYTADQTFSLGVRYRVPLDASLAKEVVLNADYYWIDDMSYTDTELPSYEVTNARLDLNGIAGSGFDFGLYVRNAFDKEYQSTANASGAFLGMTSVIFAPPRLYGAELRYTF